LNDAIDASFVVAAISIIKIIGIRKYLLVVFLYFLIIIIIDMQLAK
jgi:hypothetical protein